MPIRHYACRQCGRQLQVEQREGEADQTGCPYCHSSTLYVVPPPVDLPSAGGQTLIAGTQKKR